MEEREEGLESCSPGSNCLEEHQAEIQYRYTYEVLIANTVDLDLKRHRSLGVEILLEDVY